MAVCARLCIWAGELGRPPSFGPQARTCWLLVFGCFKSINQPKIELQTSHQFSGLASSQVCCYSSSSSGHKRFKRRFKPAPRPLLSPHSIKRCAKPFEANKNEIMTRLACFFISSPGLARLNETPAGKWRMDCAPLPSPAFGHKTVEAR